MRAGPDGRRAHAPRSPRCSVSTCCSATGGPGSALEQSSPVPILLTAPLTGGLLGALVAVATLMLWTRPGPGLVRRPAGPSAAGPGRPDKPGKAGPWETTMPRPSDRLTSRTAPPPGHDPPAGASPRSGSRAEDRPAAAGVRAHDAAPPPRLASTGLGRPAPVDSPSSRTPWLPTASDAVPRRRPGRRPTRAAVPAGVKIACILTWVFSGLVALMYAVVLVALIVAQDQIVDYVVDSPEWQRANLAGRPAGAGALARLPDVPRLVRSVPACSPGSPGAATTGRASCSRPAPARRWSPGCSPFPVGLLHQLAAALTIAGLFLSTSRAWFEQDTWATWQGPPSGPPPQAQPPPAGRPRPAAPDGPPRASHPRTSHPGTATRGQAAGLVISSVISAGCRSVARSRRMPSSRTVLLLAERPPDQVPALLRAVLVEHLRGIATTPARSGRAGQNAIPSAWPSERTSVVTK